MGISSIVTWFSRVVYTRMYQRWPSLARVLDKPLYFAETMTALYPPRGGGRASAQSEIFSLVENPCALGTSVTLAVSSLAAVIAYNPQK